MNMVKILSVVLTTAILIGATGCDPKDVSLLNKGRKLELLGKFSEATEKYAESAALGNAEALKKLGDLAISYEFESLLPEDSNDFITGHDKWVASAKQLIAKAQDMYAKAQAAGHTEQIETSLERLQKCKEKVTQVEALVAEAKEKERVRREELRKQKEEERRRAEEEARIRAEEEARWRAEEEAIAAARRAEEARRNSPEYCMDNNLELTEAAIAEVFRELTFRSETGNDIYDSEETDRHRARFMGKVIILSGQIDKVQVTAFTREVKLIIRTSSGTISARFDNMPHHEAARFRVGQYIRFRGKPSNRIVLSTIAMDYCTVL